MKKTKFNSLWKTDPRFKPWLAEHEPSPFYFYCEFCQKRIDLSNMGKTALTKQLYHYVHPHWSFNSDQRERRAYCSVLQTLALCG